MLSISPIGTASYYLDLAREDYFVEGGEPPGRWAGKGAAVYGLEDGSTVWKDHLRAILAGLNPHNTKESLVQVQGDKARQGGWDLTFSAPKSVSVLWSQADPKTRAAIQRAQDKAVRAALSYLESQALVTRTGKGGVNREFAAGGFFALFEHGTSRAHDPQVHTHSLVSNLCVSADGKTRAIWSHDLYLHKMPAGAVYRAELAYQLEQELDVEIYRPTRSVDVAGIKSEVSESWFEVQGVSEKACNFFSKRAKQIFELADRHGWTDPRVKEQLALTSREYKGHVNREESFEVWGEQGRGVGFGRREADRLVYGNKERPELNAKEIAERSRAVVKAAMSRLDEKTAYFRERDLVQYVAEECQGRRLGATDVDLLVSEAKSQLVELPDPDSLRPYYATPEMVRLEEGLLEQAERLASSETHIVASSHVEEAISEVNRELRKTHGKDARLGNEQLKALYHVVENPAALSLVQGLAGTGKTSLLKAARVAFEKSGYEVHGLAVSGKASVNILNETGIQSRSLYKTLGLLERTLRQKAGDAAGRLGKTAVRNARNSIRYPGSKPKDFPRASVSAPESLKLGRASVVIADEASMINSRDWKRLADQVEKAGAKLVVIGDRHQVQSIGAGGPFASLLDKHDHVVLQDIKRQKHEWARNAIKAFAEGDIEHAVGLYAENDAFRIAADKDEAMNLLVGNWSYMRTEDLSETVVLTSTNEEAKMLNAKIQKLRGVLGELAFGGVKTKVGETLRGGDRVLLGANDANLGVFNGDVGTIVDIQRPRGVMGPATITVRLDRKEDVGLFPKGLIGTADEPTVPLYERGRKVTIDLKDYSEIGLGYALTTPKAQGGSYDVGLVLGSPYQDREAVYTQLSRVKDNVKMYLTEEEAGENLTDFIRTAEHSRQKRLAADIELTPQQHAEREYREQSERQREADEQSRKQERGIKI